MNDLAQHNDMLELERRYIEALRRIPNLNDAEILARGLGLLDVFRGQMMVDYVTKRMEAAGGE